MKCVKKPGKDNLIYRNSMQKNNDSFEVQLYDYMPSINLYAIMYYNYTTK